jgi:hypothetical protein
LAKKVIKTKKVAVSSKPVKELKTCTFSRRFVMAFVISFIVLLLVIVFMLNLNTITGQAVSTQQCRDGRDNDADGRIDYPNDPGCSSKTDTSELNTKIQCDDGKDNDADGKIDMADFGCSGPTDTNEINCGDGKCQTGETQANCPQDCGYPNSCSDSDGGNVANVFGTASGYYNNTMYSSGDYCINDGAVNEYYCSGSLKQGVQQSCGTDVYSSGYCTGNKLYKDFVDYYCSNGVCGSITTPMMQEDCDFRDSYSSNYCYNSSVYRNFVDSSCVSGMCLNVSSTPQFIQGCPYGCSNGVCNSGPADSCSDSDNGLVYETKGTVSGYFSGQAYNNADYCTGNKTLTEFYCSGNNKLSNSSNCAFVCSDGACIAAPADSCSDSDNGLVYTTKGSVSGYKAGQFYSYSDFCIGNVTVMEYYCSGNSKMNLTSTCRSNMTFVCSNGACV